MALVGSWPSMYRRACALAPVGFAVSLLTGCPPNIVTRDEPAAVVGKDDAVDDGSICDPSTRAATGSFEITSESEMTNLSGCVDIDGNVIVYFPLTDFSPLSSLRTVTGMLQMDVTRVTELSLPALESVGVLYLGNSGDSPLSSFSSPALTRAVVIDAAFLTAPLQTLSFPALTTLGGKLDASVPWGCPLPEVSDCSGGLFLRATSTLTSVDLPALVDLSFLYFFVPADECLPDETVCRGNLRLAATDICCGASSFAGIGGNSTDAGCREELACTFGAAAISPSSRIGVCTY